jgi:hypothetical protein
VEIAGERDVIAVAPAVCDDGPGSSGRWVSAAPTVIVRP